MKMEAVHSSETLVTSYMSTQRYNPDDLHSLQNLAYQVSYIVYRLKRSEFRRDSGREDSVLCQNNIPDPRRISGNLQNPVRSVNDSSWELPRRQTNRLCPKATVVSHSRSPRHKMTKRRQIVQNTELPQKSRLLPFGLERLKTSISSLPWLRHHVPQQRFASEHETTVKPEFQSQSVCFTDLDCGSGQGHDGEGCPMHPVQCCQPADANEFQIHYLLCTTNDKRWTRSLLLVRRRVHWSPYFINPSNMTN